MPSPWLYASPPPHDAHTVSVPLSVMYDAEMCPAPGAEVSTRASAQRKAWHDRPSPASAVPTGQKQSISDLALLTEVLLYGHGCGGPLPGQKRPGVNCCGFAASTPHGTHTASDVAPHPLTLYAPGLDVVHGRQTGVVVGEHTPCSQYPAGHDVTQSARTLSEVPPHGIATYCVTPLARAHAWIAQLPPPAGATLRNCPGSSVRVARLYWQILQLDTASAARSVYCGNAAL